MCELIEQGGGKTVNAWLVPQKIRTKPALRLNLVLPLPYTDTTVLLLIFTDMDHVSCP